MDIKYQDLCPMEFDTKELGNELLALIEEYAIVIQSNPEEVRSYLLEFIDDLKELKNK
jgi:hypothetical protein